MIINGPEYVVIEKDRYNTIIELDDDVRIHIGCYADEDFEDKYSLELYEVRTGWGEKEVYWPNKEVCFTSEKAAIEHAIKYVREHL